MKHFLPTVVFSYSKNVSKRFDRELKTYQCTNKKTLSHQYSKQTHLYTALIAPEELYLTKEVVTVLLPYGPKLESTR